MKISKNIKNLIKIEKTSDGSFLCDDFTIDWKQLDEIFPKNEFKNLENFDDCFYLKRAIDPIILSSQSILSNKDSFKQSLKEFSSWTFAEKKLMKIFDDFCEDPEELSLASVLQVTAIIDFSLGSVYKTFTKKPPPHLLKDVLAELAQISCFDFNQIFLLQILVGTSKGVNLRNVAWHGFLDSLDSAYYFTFLLVIIVSYGKQLKEKLMVISRHQDELSLEISISLHENFDKLINMRSIKVSNLKAWKTILNLYKKNNCVPGIFLILSQLEGLLRQIYGEVNEVDVTAEVNKYYIIMDSIFYWNVLKNDVTPLMIGKITKIQELEIRKTCSRNKMLETFPRSLIMLYHDLFFAVEGPRIRDKLSHGEIILNEENSREILKLLLNFTMIVLEFYDEKISSFKYESIFMTSFQFARAFNSSYQKLHQTLVEIKIPEAFTLMKIEIDELKINLDDIKISFLPLIEPQFSRLMLNILQNLNSSFDNFQTSTNDLFELFKLRKLSSGRREMLKNLIDFIPTIAHGIEKILKILFKIFFFVQNLDDKFDDEMWTKRTLKLLKQALKLSENLTRYFSIEHRNYFEGHQRICEFIESTKNCEKIFE